MTYSEKLKDPRWQKKRLQIFNRDKWACKECGAKNKTLHVHHTKYFNNTDPWEYPKELLVTLCKDCHGAEHGIAKQVVQLERKHIELIPSSDDPDVIISITQQINQLTLKLGEFPDIEIETEIIKNIQFLHEQRKLYTT
jgi:hypothetical protein